MSVKAVVLAVAVAAVFAGLLTLTPQVERHQAACHGGAQGQAAASGEAHGHAKGHRSHARDRVMVGPTCNLVETAMPAHSTYRPDVAVATEGDRARAHELLRGVNEFCRTQSAPELMAEWAPGPNGSDSTHFFNPDRQGSMGLDPSNPRAVLIYRDEIGGVMFTGVPLPALGSIPRPHSHDTPRPREMLHVYCTTNLREAFTPSRQLGVMADSITLRARARPLVPQLMQPQLREMLRLVRGYAGEELRRVDPEAVPPTGPADAVLWAKREEIRQSLKLLSEPQLRRVLWLLSGGAP